MPYTNIVSHIYNPQNQTEVELMKSFVVREKEFATIFKDIEGSKMDYPEPHYIIQGQRGQGKTTLLLKLYYEIRKHRKLNQFVIPLIFNEEQYHINSLFELWSHTAEELETENHDFIGLHDEIEDLYESSQDSGGSSVGVKDLEMNAFKLLDEALKARNKKLILLVDNIGQMLDKFSLNEQHRLREVLLTCPAIRIIGASAVVLEHTYDYSKPFYELFHIINLKGLTQKETKKLFSTLGKHYKQDNVEKILRLEPGRLETLRRLSGGVPRTMVLLFEIFVDHENGNAFLDLDHILDRVTPLYKHRMDDLSAQQQKIVNAIALNWDAMTAKELAKATHMESKAVSSHLKLLEKNRIIQKVKSSTKNYLYSVAERFFNIWYLMRYGKRRGKNRVLWLVHFLEEWCSDTELAVMTKKHIHALGNGMWYPHHALYLTEALAGSRIERDLQHELITCARDYLEKKDKTLLAELSQSDKELYRKAMTHYGEKEYKKSLACLEAIQNKDEYVLVRIGVIYKMGLKQHEKADKYFRLAMEKGNERAAFFIGILHQREWGDPKNAEKYYLIAAENGNAGAMAQLGLLYDSEFKDFKKAEEYLVRAVEKKAFGARTFLAVFYFYQKRYREKVLKLLEEEAKEKAITTKMELSNQHNVSMALLWNYRIEESLAIMHKLMALEEYIEEFIEVIREYLIHLMAKKQYYAALKMFNQNRFQLKERVKPIYYALMFFLKDDFPNEYRKMGEELEQTVEEVIETVKQWEIDYA